MKKTLKLIIVTLICVMLCSSCSNFKFTPQMQECIDIYLDAIEKNETKTSGHITVTSVADDNAIEYKRTESVINFDYSITDGKVSYQRNDCLNGKTVAEYKCDGQRVLCYDENTNSWIDKTEQNKAFLSSKSNPLTTLSLFRVDNNKKLRRSNFESITSHKDADMTVVVFTLDDSTVSTVLEYNKADGIVRESAGHTRSYYIDSDGFLRKVIVEAIQNVTSNDKISVYKTTMTVEIS